MSHRTNNITETQDYPTLVPAAVIARKLGCTPRYVHLLRETNEIPGHLVGKRLIRYNPREVFSALGIQEKPSSSNRLK